MRPRDWDADRFFEDLTGTRLQPRRARAVGPAEIVLVDPASEADQGRITREPPPALLTRILFPALGFPAVVTPGANPSTMPSLEVDATRCMTIVLLSNRAKLTAEEVAQHLRVVPWADRSRRFISAPFFKPEDLLVRTHSAATPLAISQPKSATEQLLEFGGTRSHDRAIVANLSSAVRKLYTGWGLESLHEIRVSEAATARLAEGTYHLFFNNLTTKTDAPSDELALLIRRWATPRRTDEGGRRWASSLPALLAEYEYEYGSIHAPYKFRHRGQPRRTEILHPVFIRKSAPSRLRIGHITDLHVDARHDVYEQNLREQQKLGKVPPLSFNNWNESVAQIYAFAKRDADVFLLTGDLVDYGRGHIGTDYAKHLGENEYYHRDRNWFLLYDVLVAEDRYTVPTYTSLGNHDWRVNPYTPHAPGAPDISSFINDYDCFSGDQLTRIIDCAHDKGYDLPYSYDRKWRSLDLVDIVSALGLVVTQSTQLDDPGLPTETTVESVIWYLLAINPFLDYLWAMPNGHHLLMLDWAKDEGLLFPTIDKGKTFPYLPNGLREAARPGPKALRCLTDTQKAMVERLVGIKNQPAKIIGVHAPPIGPWYDWGNDDLPTGFKRYRTRRTRGPVNYAVRKAGDVTPLNGHPMFAIKPRRAPDGNNEGMTADYGSFMRCRPWFIRTVAKPDAGVRLVLSGHIHRNGLFAVRIATRTDGAILDGEYLVRSVEHLEINEAKPPAISLRTKALRAPLYVNTTSAGPRGNAVPIEDQHLNVDPGYAWIDISADGVIHTVSFRRPVNAPPPSCDVAKKRTERGLPAFVF